MKKADRSYFHNRNDMRLAVFLMSCLVWHRIGTDLASSLLWALGWATLIRLESLVAKERHSAPQLKPFGHSTAGSQMLPSFKPSHLSVPLVSTILPERLATQRYKGGVTPEWLIAPTPLRWLSYKASSSPTIRDRSLGLGIL